MSEAYEGYGNHAFCGRGGWSLGERESLDREQVVNHALLVFRMLAQNRQYMFSSPDDFTNRIRLCLALMRPKRAQCGISMLCSVLGQG